MTAIIATAATFVIVANPPVTVAHLFMPANTGTRQPENGTITSGDAAMCKYFCANAAFEVVDSAMQVLGGVGIAGNHRISRFWRDLRVDRVSGGSDEMQILTLGRAVLKQYR
ncbi:crotonobetainyl-CoA dehydrogenase [Escherichia coli B7A]|nr:crotonobetainyl-CoA dehydrogenase [Escherichia coli B7A]